MEDCGQTKVTIAKGTKRGVLTLERGPSKEHSIMERLLYKWSWPIQTIEESLRVTQMLPAMNLEQ
jgi:hypothetical protein